MSERQRDWQSMLAALVYSLCWSICAVWAPIVPIEKKPAAVPVNAAPAYDPNNYYPDCEDWEDIEASLSAPKEQMES